MIGAKASTMENPSFEKMGVLVVKNDSVEVFEREILRLVVQFVSFFIERRSDLERIRSHVDRVTTKILFTQGTQNGSMRELRFQKRYPEIIGGRSAASVEMFELLDKIVPTTASILIEGESGTGKDLVARAIHKNGPLSAQPMVALNCAALSQSILESQLFGHKKGSFSGAVRDQVGLLEMGDGGTVFLDEIGELPLEAQVKLLRVLQDGEVRPVGSDQSKKIKFRLICATNRNLEKMMDEGSFRRDLFYRINVIYLRVPSLKERAADIPLLVDFYLKSIAEKTKKPKKSFSGSAMKALIRAPWPGNIRQLQNTLETICALNSRQRIGAEQLPADRLEIKKEKAMLSFDAARNQFLKEYLEDLLAVSGNKVSAAAALAGIERESFYRLMRRHLTA